MNQPLHATLHRTAKYFMDNGRAESPEAAMRLLQTFGLTIAVGPEIATSREAQIALLTLVNLARRTFLAGVEVTGLASAKTLVPLALEPTLADAVRSLGGRIVSRMRADWPVAVIGTADISTATPAWRLNWQGWRAGVVPYRECESLIDGHSIPLAPALAAAICAAEAFALHAGDHALAGKRRLGLSLWRPGTDWMTDDPSEPELTFLPSRLWLIGLGNLGQAYAWLLACLPYAAGALELVLQDDDRLAVSNDSTSILTSLDVVGRMKTRWVADWMEAQGCRAYLEERRFGSWTRRTDSEAPVALCGVDNARARSALEQAGFGLVVESGLGAGPAGFRNFSMHTFPGPRRAEQLWSTSAATNRSDVSNMPAYAKLAKDGLDQCGLAQLASRTVGVPFVGLVAAAFVISELLRRLHGGAGYSVISGSTMCLDDLEVVEGVNTTYAYGYVPVGSGAE